LCCEKYDLMASLGRFTLRDEGKTIATGKITKVKSILKAEKEVWNIIWELSAL